MGIYITNSYSDGPSWTRTTRTENAFDTFGIRVSMKRDSGLPTRTSNIARTERRVRNLTTLPYICKINMS